MNTLTDGSILRSLGVVLERDEHGTARPVPAAGEVVTVCAWCDWDKSQTRALMAQGRRVSHTCCPEHTRQQIERARELNRPAASKEAA